MFYASSLKLDGRAVLGRSNLRSGIWMSLRPTSRSSSTSTVHARCLSRKNDCQSPCAAP